MADSRKAHVASLLEKLTTSGKAELDSDGVRELKRICKQSSDCIDLAHESIMKQLRTKHSEVRLSCMQIIQFLFEKSARFRHLLLDENFEDFLALVTGFALAASKKPLTLPPPEHVAKRLRDLALDAVKRWKSLYGDEYPRLEVAVRFLDAQVEATKVLRRSDDGTTATDVLSRREQMRTSALARQATRARDEFEDKRTEIDECISELRNAVELLVPRLEDFAQTGRDNCQIDAVDLSLSKDSSSLPANYEIIVEINQKSFRLRRNEDNAVIVDNLSERLKQVEQSLLPDLRKWLGCLQKSTGGGFEDDVVKECIDYKNILMQLQNRASTIGIESKKTPTNNKIKQHASPNDVSVESDIDDVENDDEFVDAGGCSSSATFTAKVTRGEPIDRLLLETEYGLPPVINDPEPDASALVDSATTGFGHKKVSPPSAPATSATKPLLLTQSINCLLHPTPAFSTDDSSKKTNSTQPNAKNAPPTVPYGVDLEYWGRESQLRMPDRVAPLDAVWSMARDDDGGGPESSASATTRTYPYKSEWKPVDHICRVPLSNGKLCPRQDRYKCPLHGSIIPRNAVGQPLDPQQAAALASSAQNKGILSHLIKSSQQQEQKPWQDAELMRDIEAQTGITFATTNVFKRTMRGANTSARGGRSANMNVNRRMKLRNSNLTDVNAAKNTVAKRLEKKLFETKTVKRVGEQMDREVRKRNDEKFQHQWNYSG